MEPLPLKVMLSKPVAPSGLEALGRTHYSYGFAARNFTRMLQEAGCAVAPLAHPERFKTSVFGQTLGLHGSAHPHLIFRSTEDIRTVPGAWNIACFAWEFDVLSEPGPADEPVLRQQTTMLGTVEEIWAPCRFTEGVLRTYGFENVRFVPSPVFPPLAPRGPRSAAWEVPSERLACPLVCFSSNMMVDGYDADLEEDYVAIERDRAGPLADQARLALAIAQGGRIFVSVLNPYDRRKNLANMIDGFLMATQGVENAVLVIKLITSGEVERPAGYLYHQLRGLLGRPHCIDEDRIVLAGGFWTDEEMGALFNGADFYLCTSLAEGQNAPLLEAIRHGCAPVSTANTAMADYIDSDTAVVIGERRFSGLVPGLAAEASRRLFSTDFADRYAVAEAVQRALLLSRADIERLAAAAFARAKPNFWIEDVAPIAIGRLGEIDRALAPARLRDA